MTTDTPTRRVLIFYPGAFMDGHYLVTDPHPEDLAVLQRWHEVCTDQYDWEDDEEHDAIIRAADRLIENWDSLYKVGTGDNPSMIDNVDQVRFYGLGDGS